MGASLFPVVPLRKFSLLWISHSSHQLRNLLLGIFMMLNGSLNIYSEDSPNAIYLQRGGVFLLVRKDL
uniref:Uncharacterized protein n=1 Tax=Rhizophora mucronata TaxID=61149 RepID=A0A2P2NMY0_RHIMU